MDQKKIKAAVIGLGDISGIHISALMEQPGVSLAAVCDTDPGVAENAPQGIPFYQDYLEMIGAIKPDVVHICLPHHLHVPVAETAICRGIHVFCEKPVAMNMAEAEAFAALEAEHPKIHIGVCLQNRCNESVEMLKSMIDSGEYGQVLGLRGYVPWSRSKEYYDIKPWRGKRETAGGGCMINQSVHTLDLLYFLGGQINGVKASVSQLLDYGIEVEDTVSARLDYVSGARGLFMATNANFQNESVQIAVWLEKGSFIIMDNILYCVDEDGSKTKLCEDRKMPGGKFYYGASHSKLIGKFYRAVAEKQQNYIHVRDAVMSIRLIDTIMESSKRSTYIEL